MNSPRAGDVSHLYDALSVRLEQIVRFDVSAPDQVVEDACQYAWTQLVIHADRVRRDKALSWLATTAIREALKLLRRQRWELLLEDVSGAPTTLASGPEVVAEQRERLAAVQQLPERQQRLVWLHGLGLTYAEMAAEAGCTRRTVERQLGHARRTLRATGIAA
jgi:RNA polymerase sigma factor (sigma-70 family)